MQFMLDEFLPTVVDLSLVGSYAIVFVLIARLFLKKSPKIYSYVLWSVVLFRLVCPVSFESTVAIMPSQTVVQNQTSYVNEVVMPSVVFEVKEGVETSVKNDVVVETATEIPMSLIMFGIWMLGISTMVLYSAYSLVKTRKNLVGCMWLKDNIYLADGIKTPFVLGVVKPKIYLPSSINKDEMDFIIEHEKIHIKRFDHVTRVIAFFTLCVHFFNPLVWCAYILSAKDMEMSCDEAVMNKLGMDIKSEYSISLLRLTTDQHLISPLAFSEGDTKERVKNVMTFKKPAVWVTVVCVVFVGVLLFAVMGTQSQISDYNGELAAVYKEIQNNETLSKPIKILYNTKVGDEQYIGVLAGKDIVLSTAKNVNGEWVYQGDTVFTGANDKESVVVCRKGNYDIVLSSNPDISNITKTLNNGEEFTVNAVYSDKVSMTLISVNVDNDYVEMKYNDNTFDIDMQSVDFENYRIKAVITEIDRESNTLKVSPLEEHHQLNENIILDIEKTSFSNAGKNSTISEFSVGYTVDVYVNDKVVDGKMYPFEIEMSGGTGSSIVDDTANTQTIYAYTQNSLVPLNLLGVSNAGEITNSVHYTQAEYENPICFYSDTQKMTDVIKLSFDKDASEIEEWQSEAKVISVKQYFNGEEKLWQNYDSNFIEIELDAYGNYLYEVVIDFGENFAIYAFQVEFLAPSTIRGVKVTENDSTAFLIPTELYDELIFNIMVSSIILPTELNPADIVGDRFYVSKGLSSAIGDVVLFIDEDGTPMALRTDEKGLTPISIEMYKKIESVSFPSQDSA